MALNFYRGSTAEAPQRADTRTWLQQSPPIKAAQIA
jgi:hypothetical protein